MSLLKAEDVDRQQWGLPCSVAGSWFDGTDDLPGIPASILWKQAMVVLRPSAIDQRGLAQELGAGGEVHGHLEMVDCANIKVVHLAGSGQKLSRLSADIDIDGVDGVLVQYVHAGNIISLQQDQLVRAIAGEICFFDLARPIEIYTSTFGSYNLLLPRELLTREGVNIDTLHLSKLACDNAVASILCRHIKDLHKNAREMDSEQAAAMVPPTLALLRAAIETSANATSVATAQTQGKAQRPIDQDLPAANQDQLISICQFIDKNLLDPDLSPEMIAQHLGLSRATLYRVAASIDGIQRFVRNRRLHYAMKCLTEQAPTARSISNLAFDLGFGSENTFRRVFKEMFGVTPTQARQKGCSIAGGVLEGTPGSVAGRLLQDDNSYPPWMHKAFAIDVSKGATGSI